jgi:hypothetical protein
MGASTTYGSSYWGISLPVAAVDADPVALTTIFLQNGQGRYQGNALSSYDGITTYVVPLLDKGAAVSAPADASTPFTWAATDGLTISGSYESAL